MVSGRQWITEWKMKIARPTRPWEAAPAGRPVQRRRRHGVEYGLVFAIVCFISISTITAINMKPDLGPGDRVAVRYQ
jgi:hypothetical protein